MAAAFLLVLAGGLLLAALGLLVAASSRLRSPAQAVRFGNVALILTAAACGFVAGAVW